MAGLKPKFLFLKSTRSAPIPERSITVVRLFVKQVFLKKKKQNNAFFCSYFGQGEMVGKNGKDGMNELREILPVQQCRIAQTAGADSQL